MAKILAIFLFGITTIQAQNSLTVHLNNLRVSGGQVEIGIFNKSEGFLKEKHQYIKKRFNLNQTKNFSYTFRNLPDGEYAVAVFHDENANGKMDTNLIGIPKEPYGFSNNFIPKIKAPSFTQTKFKLDGNKIIKISLIR